MVVIVTIVWYNLFDVCTRCLVCDLALDFRFARFAIVMCPVVVRIAMISRSTIDMCYPSCSLLAVGQQWSNRLHNFERQAFLYKCSTLGSIGVDPNVLSHVGFVCIDLYHRLHV